MCCVWPLVSSRISGTRDRGDLRYLLFALYCSSAACPFYWFAELVMTALFPVHLALGAAVARAAAAAFLPPIKPSSVAQTAHCVRIILLLVAGQPLPVLPAKSPAAGGGYEPYRAKLGRPARRASGAWTCNRGGNLGGVLGGAIAPTAYGGTGNVTAARSARSCTVQ